MNLTENFQTPRRTNYGPVPGNKRGHFNKFHKMQEKKRTAKIGIFIKKSDGLPEKVICTVQAIIENSVGEWAHRGSRRWYFYNACDRCSHFCNSVPRFVIETFASNTLSVFEAVVGAALDGHAWR